MTDQRHYSHHKYRLTVLPGLQQAGACATRPAPLVRRDKETGAARHLPPGVPPDVLLACRASFCRERHYLTQRLMQG
ncbi:hypothetical protein KX75_20515 [Salmonella enterica subsp. enterica]|nr:hypothetical protein [Salmonella enterica subsp. enterica serovar Mikawasima]EDN7229251.1 hypothetical protein [Salmonella enterica subsp. enterica serovar Mikawasima]